MGQVLCKDCVEGGEGEKEGAYAPWAEGVTKEDKASYYSKNGSALSATSSVATDNATTAMKNMKIDMHAKYRGAGVRQAGGPSTQTDDLTTEYSEKAPEVFSFIEGNLTNQINDFIFGAMSEAQRKEFIGAMQSVSYGSNEFIIRQGEIGDYFYMVDQGTVSIYTEKTDEEKDAHPPPSEGEGDHLCPSSCGDMYHEKHARKQQRRVSHNDAAISPHQKSNAAPQDKSAKGFKFEKHALVGDYTRGDTFGELALLYNCPRAATCISKTNCNLWRIEAATFNRLMCQEDTMSSTPEVTQTLKKVSIFSDLDDNVRQDIADALIAIKYKKGERIVEKGVDGNMFHIVKEGSVRIHDIGGDARMADVSIGPGDWFGEISLLKGEKTTANVTAASDVVTLGLSKEQFEAKMGQFKDVLFKSIVKKTLSAIPHFSGIQFKEEDLEKLVGLLQQVVFKDGQVLVRKGKVIVKPALYLLRSGEIQISNEKLNSVHILGENDYFGAELLIPSVDLKEWSSAMVIESVGETKCSMLTPKDIESVLGCTTGLKNASSNIFAKLDANMKMKDLKKHRILGIGAFGKVWLVEHKKTKKVYALKSMDKRTIIDTNQINFLFSEKNIMASIDHPFIINLVAVLQDSSSVHLLESFIPGGELFNVLHSDTSNGVSNDAARFYAACIWESLSHLHKKKILYRDLKPENVLIDKDGYCILIDLGLSKVVLDKTTTKCGTVEYFAPELVMGKGYNKSYDIWSFGVLLYECLIGQTPFIHANATPISLFRRIVGAKFSFPEKEKNGIDVSQHAKDLITGLLTREQEKRLGCMTKHDDDIRYHPFFEGMMEGDGLLKKKVTAPFVPEIKDSLDASNFDSYTMEETKERFKRQRALTAAEQALFNDF